MDDGTKTDWRLPQEMIADLKADSARWETDAVRRTDQGYPRGNYFHNDYHMPDYHKPSQGPNVHSTNLSSSYAQSAPIHEPRQSQSAVPSPPPTYSAPPPSQPSYMDSYPPQPPYGTSQSPSYSSPPFSTPSSYSVPHSHSPFQASQSPYTPQQTPPFTASAQPAVTADMHHPSYKYTSSGYGYEGGWNNAPRTYPGTGYDAEPDYSPATTGTGYPTTTASDHRMPAMPAMSGINGLNGMSGMNGMNGVPGMSGIPPIPGMDSRYPPESTFSDRNRPQQPRDNRRPR